MLNWHPDRAQSASRGGLSAPYSRLGMEHEQSKSERISDLFSFTFPSVCLLCIISILLKDAAMFVFRLMGHALPFIFRRGMALCFGVLNTTLGILCCIWIHRECSSPGEVCSTNMLSNSRCVKPVALCLVGLLLMSLSDRVVLLLLYPDLATTFISRMGEAGSVIMGWQLLGDREGVAPLFVTLLVCRRCRFALPRACRYVSAVLRGALATFSLLALGKNCNSTSQKASVGVLLCTLLLSSQWRVPASPALILTKK